MIEELLSLRNKVHKGEFRFDLTPSLWGSHYISEEEFGSNNVIELRDSGVLKAYAVISVVSSEENRILTVREICAKEKDAFDQLLNLIIERGVNEKADFIIWRRCQESFDEVLNKKGALTFKESMVMVALMNPKEFVRPLSDKTERGDIAKLNIIGFEPIHVRMWKDRLSIVEGEQEDFAIATDSVTFMKLFFGKSSFLKELLKGKIKVNMFHLRAANLLFKTMRNQRWYIPSGDWC